MLLSPDAQAATSCRAMVEFIGMPPRQPRLLNT